MPSLNKTTITHAANTSTIGLWGYPRLTPDSGRRTLITWCEAVDPNGVYSDADNVSEYGSPLTLNELWECVASLSDAEHTDTDTACAALLRPVCVHLAPSTYPGGAPQERLAALWSSFAHNGIDATQATTAPACEPMRVSDPPWLPLFVGERAWDVCQSGPRA